MRPQPGDEPRPVFSFLGRREEHPPQSTATSRRPTRARTRSSAPRPTARRCSRASSKASGRATARRSRTRSCASPTKASHQIFVEPEGLDTHDRLSERHLDEPAGRRAARVRAQHRAASSRREITRPGYAIEYDYFDPRGLWDSARDEADRRAVLRRARSTARRATKRRRPRACSRASTPRLQSRAAPLVAAPRRGLSRRARGRSDHARRDRALSHVHEPRRASPAAARGQRRRRLTPVARELGLVDEARWDSSAQAGSDRRHARAALGPIRGLRNRSPEPGSARKLRGLHWPPAGRVERQRRNEETRLPAAIDYAAVAGLSNEARQRRSIAGRERSARPPACRHHGGDGLGPARASQEGRPGRLMRGPALALAASRRPCAGLVGQRSRSRRPRRSRAAPWQRQRAGLHRSATRAHGSRDDDPARLL